MATLSTTESRSRLWLLLAERYEALAVSAKTEEKCTEWLKRAAEARQTAAA